MRWLRQGGFLLLALVTGAGALAAKDLLEAPLVGQTSEFDSAAKRLRPKGELCAIAAAQGDQRCGIGNLVPLRLGAKIRGNARTLNGSDL